MDKMGNVFVLWVSMQLTGIYNKQVCIKVESILTDNLLSKYKGRIFVTYVEY